MVVEAWTALLVTTEVEADSSIYVDTNNIMYVLPDASVMHVLVTVLVRA
jgi:hypothetical protein